MKSKFLPLLLLLLLAFVAVGRAEPTNASGDSIKVIHKSFFGQKKGPGATTLNAISLKVQIEAVLKSNPAASLRLGAVLANDREITTLFSRSIKAGPTALEIPVTINDFKGKTLMIVVWIDPNPDETPSPPKPIVFEKFGFDLAKI